MKRQNAIKMLLKIMLNRIQCTVFMIKCVIRKRFVVAFLKVLYNFFRHSFRTTPKNLLSSRCQEQAFRFPEFGSWLGTKVFGKDITLRNHEKISENHYYMNFIYHDSQVAVYGSMYCFIFNN